MDWSDRDYKLPDSDDMIDYSIQQICLLGHRIITQPSIESIFDTKKFSVHAD